MKHILIAVVVALIALLPAIAPADDQRLANTMIPLIWKCMSVPDDARAAGAKAILEFEVDQGYLVGNPVVVSAPKSPAEKAMAAAAVHAVLSCNPYPERISLFLRVTFDPGDVVE